MSTPRPWTFGARLGVYLAAVAVIGVGVALMVRADLGVAPNDVMNTGLSDRLAIGVGAASWLTAAIAMALAWSLGRPPRLATVLGGVVVGGSITVSLAVLPDVDALGWRVVALAVGLGIIWVGITGVVATDVGAGALELVMLALMDRRVGISAARWGIELSLLVIGLLLGGAVGIGTAAFALGTGPVLARTLPPVTRQLGTTLHRQPDAVLAASAEGRDQRRQ
jgi:uncharacterized membrane protein YczE